MDARAKELLKRNSLTLEEDAHLKWQRELITLSDLQRMKEWPKLPIVGFNQRTIHGAFVVRNSSNRNLFWRGGPSWINIYYPESAMPHIFVGRLLGHRPPDFSIVGSYVMDTHGGACAFPLTPPQGEWVLVGTAIRLYPEPVIHHQTGENL